MHSLLDRNILFGCQRCGIKVIDFLDMTSFLFSLLLISKTSYFLDMTSFIFSLLLISKTSY